ncbi:MAG: NAD(P)-binding protein [Candidatus Lokiarchaeota archaeon]|nr:NAD(P)-binding protein [Candidatus Lokiarchaeota archaeon]
MKILEDALIKNEYDVIIVGAGIGGITAGALLANKGIDTLVIDQHFIPGGACSSLKKMGQATDIGAALLFGFDSNEGFSPHSYVMNVLKEPINMINHDSMYRCNFTRKDGEPVEVTFWKDFNKFFNDLVVAFPEHKNEMESFFENLEDIYGSLMALTTSVVPVSEQGLLDKIKMFFKHPILALKLFNWMNTDMKSLMDKHFKNEDPRVKTFFDLLLSLMLTTKVEETPILLAAAIFMIGFHGGACYPQGSPQGLPNALERSLEKNKGSILYRHKVDKILFDDSSAYGVRLSDGMEIYSKYVISDASIWQNFNSLIPKELLSSEKIEWANSFKPTLSAMIMYMGVKEEAIPKNTRAIEMYIEDIADYESGIEVLYIPSMDDPSIAPEGVHSITIIAQLQEEFPAATDPRYQSEEYYDLKEKEAERVLDALEKYLPNLKDNIIWKEVATPSTIERFTMREYGSIGGPKQAIGQHLLKRPGAKSDFKNLYYVGDSTTMGEGVVSTTQSAIGAVNLILKKEGKKIYKNQKFEKNYVNFVEGTPRPPMPKIEEELDDDKAKRVAWECQWCLDAKCIEGCPANVDVPSFMRRIEAKNYIGAAKSIREMNPLGEIGGYVCPAEKFCQKDCEHNEFSVEPVRINQLQAWVCERAGEKGWDKTESNPNGKSVAIVGAGPSGLTCAYYLGKLGYNIKVYDKNEEIGGMVSQVIPKFRLPKDAINRDLNGIKEVSMVDFILNTELGKDITVSSLTEGNDAVFLAPGLWSGRMLEIPGIKKANAIDALSFIKKYNINRDLQVGKKVIIIGGGSVAADAAVIAKKSGAKKVTIVCLESEDEMPCLDSEVNEIKHLGVEVKNCWGPKEIRDNKTTFVECTTVFDKDGNFDPIFNDENTLELEFDEIIIAIGQNIESKLAEHLQKELGTNGLISVNPDTQLIKGKQNIYAGGDIIRGAGTVVQSIADGRRAAMAINKNLNG